MQLTFDKDSDETDERLKGHNVMEQFNPSLKNLVNLGKTYEKTVTVMTAAGKAYFDAVSKIGENAIVSPVSRELGEFHASPVCVFSVQFKRFRREIITNLEKKLEMDGKYMTATYKRYQLEHKLKQDSLDRSQTDLKKVRRKRQGKSSSKYEVKENEYLQAVSSRQRDMQKFISDGCKEALLEELRRFCFVADKHCMFCYQMSNFHEKAKETLAMKLHSWQEKCNDISNVPDTAVTMIEGLSTSPDQSPLVQHYNRNNMDSVEPPPPPPLKAQTSPLASMFDPDLGEGSLSRSPSQSSVIHMGRKIRVRTVFPHMSANDTLLSFEDGDIINLLVHDEKDGWLYGELDKSGRRGWFPSSYCRPYTEPVISNCSTPVRSLSVVSLPEEEEEEEEEDPVLLPPPDYSDDMPSLHMATSATSSQNTVSLVNGTLKAPFLGGGNPFATVKLRPTVTNDRSAPII
uniref:BAR/IMD domain-containing adapter protein 2-like 1 n=1 Tax=Mastacembelus armatus TaxID=205130 RepID=A0A7N9AXB2_9TELE